MFRKMNGASDSIKMENFRKKGFRILTGGFGQNWKTDRRRPLPGAGNWCAGTCADRRNRVKKSKSLIAFFLAASLTFSPLSYIRAYAAETGSREEIGESSGEGTKKEEQPEMTAESKEEEIAEEESTEAESTEEESADDESKEKAESTEASESGEAEPEESSEAKEEESKEASESAEESEKAAESTEEESEASTKDTGSSSEGSRKEESTASAQNLIPKTDALLAVNRIAVFSMERTIVPTPSAEITGVTVLKWDADSQSHTQYGMFPVTVTSMAVSGQTIRISFHTGAKAIFDWLYFGNLSDENKTADFVGTKEGSTCKFEIEVPVSKRNSWVPMVLGRSDKGTWSDNNLWMSIPNVPVITKQPQREEAKVGGNVTLSVEVTGEGLTYQWQFMADGGETWADCEGESAKTAAYGFEMAETLVGQYRCVITDKNGVKAESDAVEVFVAEEKPEDDGFEATGGIGAVYGKDYSKNPSGSFSMFKVSESKATVKGSEINIAIWVAPKSASNSTFTYNAIYLGRYGDTMEPLVYGEIDEEKGLQKYTFTVPYSAKGTDYPFVPVKADGTAYKTTQLYLTIPSVFSAPEDPAAVTVTTQPAEMTSAIAGSNVTLSVEAEGEGLTYRWQFSTDGTVWTDCAEESAKTAAYSFTMTKMASGRYRCVIADKNGTEEISNTAAVAEPVFSGAKVRVVKKDGTDFKMFTVADSTVTEDGENLTVVITTENVSYDKLYLGSKDDALKIPIISGTEAEGGWSFEFTVPASCKGETLPITLGYPTGSAKDWYVNQYLWIYIPDEGITELPEAVNEIQAITGGTGISYKDFQIVSSRAVLKQNQVLLTLTVNGRKWTRLYQGVQADTKKAPFYSGTYDEASDTTTFTFAVPAGKQGMNIPVTPGTESSWFAYARDLFINVPRLEEVAKTSADGIYELYGSAFPIINYAALHFERESSLTIDGDAATVTLITQTNQYDKIYIGSVDDPDSVKNAGAAEAVARTDIGDAYKCFTFTIPTTDLGKEINYVVHIQSSDSWAVKQSSFRINEILEKIGSLPGGDPDPEPTPDPEIPADGIYDIEVESSASMFRVVDCVLTVKGGKMSAVLTLSGTGYDYLYPGTKEEAAATASSAWSPYVKNAEGKYTYTIPVEGLDKGIAVAAHSISKNIWYDRTLTFKSDTLKKLSDLPGGSDTPGTTPTDPTDPSNPGNTGIDDPETTIPDNDGKEDQESQYVSDTSGSTGRIDSSTTLADGVYKPDKFSWSGGTGKVKISCNKITVKNGQAYATLAFSSDSYQYVKANGNTYYAGKSGGQATVVIPVALNRNNRILGMTTKMSATHEIEYNIFIYLAAAGNGQTIGENSNEKLDEEAPEIIGLEYKSETELDFAEYFKIYHYDQGIVLLEVDMTRDTARDPEKLAEAKNSEDKADKKETEKKAEKAEETLPEEEGEITVSQNEIAAELYKGNVVKYLLVPENVEIPVGLEQDMIIVTLPLDRTYAASDEILEVMESLDLLDQVASVGCEQKDCKVDTVAERMKVRDGEKEADVVYGGLFDAPDFKALIKQEINLAILPGTLLPRDEEDPDMQDSTVEKNTDSAAKKNAGNEQELTAEEQTERLESLTEKFAMFGIPVVIDRSADEETELAKYEWIKVYGVLFGCEEEMDELFETAVKEAEQQESRR